MTNQHNNWVPALDVPYKKHPVTRSKARGFTLIELIAVIIILGFLAVAALPKLINLRSDAASTATQHMGAALQAASAMAHAKCMATSGCNTTSGNATVVMGSTTVSLWNGYIDAGDSIAGSQIDVAVSTTGFTVSIQSTRHRFVHNSATNPATCNAEYTEALSANTLPTITVVTSGC